MITEAGATNARAQLGDAWATGLDPGTFDVVNIRHVLAHNTPAHQRDILAHALELLRPGGHLYVVDVDLTAMRMDPTDPDVEDLAARYVRHLTDTGRDPTVGPRLGSAARAVGFALVERWATSVIPPSAALASIRPPAWAARDAMVESGHADADDIARWDAALTSYTASAVENQAAIFNAAFGLVARKPG
jgi:SAM-dependent methyltransferase